MYILESNQPTSLFLLHISEAFRFDLTLRAEFCYHPANAALADVAAVCSDLQHFGLPWVKSLATMVIMKLMKLT